MRAPGRPLTACHTYERVWGLSIACRTTVFLHAGGWRSACLTAGAGAPDKLRRAILPLATWTRLGQLSPPNRGQPQSEERPMTRLRPHAVPEASFRPAAGRAPVALLRAGILAALLGTALLPA